MLPKSDAGKGDDPRIGFDYKKFWTNFDLISSVPSQTKAKKIIKRKGKTIYVY